MPFSAWEPVGGQRRWRRKREFSMSEVEGRRGFIKISRNGGAQIFEVRGGRRGVAYSHSNSSAHNCVEHVQEAKKHSYCVSD